MTQLAIVAEKGPASYGAYVPDLPRCAAVGETEQEVRQLIREGIRLHLQAMLEDGDTIPEPASKVKYVALPIAS